MQTKKQKHSNKGIGREVQFTEWSTPDIFYYSACKTNAVSTEPQFTSPFNTTDKAEYKLIRASPTTGL